MMRFSKGAILTLDDVVTRDGNSAS